MDTEERIKELESAIEFALWRLYGIHGKSIVDEKRRKTVCERLQAALGRPLLAHIDVETLPDDEDIANTRSMG